MGEDAQLQTSEDERALSPIVDGTIGHDEWQDQWIYSIDGSYAADKRRLPFEQEELPPYSENSLIQQLTVRSAVSRDSLGTLSGIVLDESHRQTYYSKRSQSVIHADEIPSIIQLPQSLEIPLKNDRLHTSRTKNHQREQARMLHDISTIRRSAGVQGNGRLTRGTTQIYDPLRRISIPNDGGFSSELQAQGDKLMNGLKAILNEKLSKEKFTETSSSFSPNMINTTLSRVGSSSTVSTGRDVLTREVRRLEDAFAGISLRAESRARAGGGSYSELKRDHTNPGTSSMPDMLSQERPFSGSNGTSTVERARLSSRGSIQILTETAIRDAENSSSVLRRLGGASSQLSTKLLREQSTNTYKDPVRRFVITHRVKHPGCCLGRNRMHLNESLASQLKPSYHPFKLRPTVSDSQQLFDMDKARQSDKRLLTRETEFDDESEWEDGGRHVEHFRRKTGGGKRGRPIIGGRTLYGRGRVHFRPMGRHKESSKSKTTITVPSTVRSSPTRQDAATITEQEDVVTALEASPEFMTKNEIDHDEAECSLPEKPKQKSVIHQKVPFVGSGLKCSNTFSVVGNQQQVMKIVSIRFQEWLPLVRSIIYDSQCKDYAQALLRDLRRQKRSNLEQIHTLERDLDSCTVDSEKREISSDITRLKQCWTRKHERVLKCLSEHISKGGVHSKVQQLRTIYGACAS